MPIHSLCSIPEASVITKITLQQTPCLNASTLYSSHLHGCCKSTAHPGAAVTVVWQRELLWATHSHHAGALFSYTLGFSDKQNTSTCSLNPRPSPPHRQTQHWQTQKSQHRQIQIRPFLGSTKAQLSSIFCFLGLNEASFKEFITP